MKKGYTVSIPTYALHHMEEYYPDPEKFDPERYNNRIIKLQILI
jgi:cytochrome P450